MAGKKKPATQKPAKQSSGDKSCGARNRPAKAHARAKG